MEEENKHIEKMKDVIGMITVICVGILVNSLILYLFIVNITPEKIPYDWGFSKTLNWCSMVVCIASPFTLAFDYLVYVIFMGIRQMIQVRMAR